MAAQLAIGNVDITGSVTATVTATKVTLSTFSIDRSGSGTTNTGNVPTSKVWRIISIQIAASYTGTTTTNLALNPVASSYSGSLASVNFAGSGTQLDSKVAYFSWDYGCCPVLAAGASIDVISGANQTARVVIGYIEEAA